MKKAARKCPCCRGALYIRTSKEETPCFSSMYYQCSNVVCGATFVGTQTIDYQLSDSGMAKPLLVLPVAPAIERMKALQASRKETNQLDLLEEMEATV